MWILNLVTGSFQDKFYVMCILEQLIDDDVKTYIEVFSELDQMWKDAVMT
jgi:hypothetical protein